MTTATTTTTANDQTGLNVLDSHDSQLALLDQTSPATTTNGSKTGELGLNFVSHQLFSLSFCGVDDVGGRRQQKGRLLQRRRLACDEPLAFAGRCWCPLGPEVARHQQNSQPVNQFSELLGRLPNDRTCNTCCISSLQLFTWLASLFWHATNQLRPANLFVAFRQHFT